MNQNTLTANSLEQYLGKPSSEFKRDDIIKFMEDNGIGLLNFRYVGEDGKLKTLNFAPTNKQHLEDILTFGERVDGSSLFSYIDHASSDLYVIPKYRTAFVNPFSELPTLDILCSFFTPDGKPLESSPEYVLQKTYEYFKKETGYVFKTLGELEYYIKGSVEDLYPDNDQKGYHSSSPFTKYEYIRQEAMDLLVLCGGKVKYGHSEVGTFTTDDYLYEQHEIEFLAEEPEQAIEHLILTKWILRKICDREGLMISWAPKITEGKAGSGLHFHMQLEDEGKNIMLKDGELSTEAKKMIAGILDAAGALTAFGNTVPTAYLRLVPGQEAPTYVCWGYRNRSALVRVPLGWSANVDMAKIANPNETADAPQGVVRQTVEFRVPDGSADVYLLMAGLITATLHGLKMDNALELADQTFASMNIFSEDFKENLKKLEELPGNCYESGEVLLAKRNIFEQFGFFPAGLIESTAQKLKAYNDQQLSERLQGDEEGIKIIVEKFMHCM
ncbi:glutamine synthetase [Balneicella halophila]|uniref:Glutamine synthetase n=1 Tax=Balneicella halophila TaxID=1537566 RepID=A0A7L4UNP6_BALHA|nr:glutamine synthetase family protein [Balneicella halophila]PVX50810.1 glutamine synthetase [Balneicella halophila]